MRSAACIPLPKTVEHALALLRSAGFSSYAVGGCVRDALLGRKPNDWDITTAATPLETKAVFSEYRVIETGIRHGTVTVLMEGEPLEITTFRNDGEYKDNRHPVAVTFSDTVDEDLARRDFTVNAMAYHPAEGLVDLFGGREDLEHRIIRCVGDPETRFREDGLRILRAIRFASVLDFSIDETTAQAVHRLRFLLANIAKERIREELCKLLCGKGAARILREYTDVIAEVLPEITPAIDFPHNSKYHCYDVWEHTLQAIDASPADLRVRLALLFHDLGKPAVKTEDSEGWHFKGHAEVSVTLADCALRRLCTDNATRESVLTLVRLHDRELVPTPRAVKRLMLKMSDEDIERLLHIQRADRHAHAKGYDTPSPALDEILPLVRTIREEHACLSLRDLAVGGNDLMDIGIPRGKQLGTLLNALLERVLDGDLPNEKDALLAAARTLANATEKSNETEARP